MTNQPTQPQKTSLPRRIIIFCVYALALLFTYSFVSTIVKSAYEANRPKQDFTGFTISRENFVRNCTSGGSAETRELLTAEQIEGYCGCTYDRGVDTWGGELMTIKAQKFEMADWNNIVNECVAKVME